MTQPHENYDDRMAPFTDSLPADEAVLIPLYNAYRAGSEALMGVLHQPGVKDGPAAEMIEDEIERLDDHACAVALKLCGLTSIKKSQRENFIEEMLSHLFFAGWSLSDTAHDVLSTLAAAMALPVTEEETSH